MNLTAAAQRARRGDWCVYVASDKVGAAVYVGKSRDLPNRIKAHRSTSDWAARSGLTIDATFVSGALEAAELERETITRLDAANNVMLKTTELRNKPRHALPANTASTLRALYEGAAVSRDWGTFRHYVVLLRGADWSLSEIGTAVGMTNEAIRQHEKRAVAVAGTPDNVPMRPAKVKAFKPARKRLTVKPEVAEYLRGLQALASTVNGATPLDHPNREASRELSEALDALLNQGVTHVHLCEVLGVSRMTIRFRLGRHGYRSLPPSLKPYQGVQTKGRVSVACSHGHDMTGDNLRITVPGGARVCRTCERMRVNAYRARQKVA